ncbi:MAG TPA: methylenetetrahydrofolate reductase [Xanthobacteraceae bacterium]|nr:methylenetetrahydrofolate reductase [Xanthobacteraceae bacterium]
MTGSLMTIAPSRPPAADDASADAARRIVALAQNWSLEATLPTAAEIAGLAAVLRPGTQVYLSAVPTRDPTTQIEPAVRLAAAGFVPVPHVAVRNFASLAALEAFLARMVGDAGVRRVLIIAGDRDQPAGAFRDAIEAIDSGLLQRHGIAEIGIAGYPEGHDRLARHELDRALNAKIEIAAQIGLKVHIVTQFGFAAEPIIGWIERLRDFGIENPVRIGLAGPSNIATLLRYARRCGVRASAQGLARQSGLARQMFGMSAPDALVRALAGAQADGMLGDIALHFYSFGGVAATARWAGAVAAGRITPDATGGFSVAPPR